MRKIRLKGYHDNLSRSNSIHKIIRSLTVSFYDNSSLIQLDRDNELMRGKL